MNNIKLYLGGAIFGIPPEDARAWRKVVTLDFPEAINPMKFQYHESMEPSEVVLYDLQNLATAQALLVRWDHRWPPSVGTAMEMVYYRRMHSAAPKCILWKDAGWAASPWLFHHADEVVNRYADAKKILREWFPGAMIPG